MKKKKLKILYEDKYIIIVNKPAGQLTIDTDKIKQCSIYSEVYDYLKKKHKSNKVFIVHRLDKDTSGIILFAKNEKIKQTLQNNWNNFKRYYYAIINGDVSNDNGVIKSYLKETKTLYVYSSSDKVNGKLAITEYKKICKTQKYTLLHINILTGRKNQIRVHLKDINCPLLGDKKYGIKDKSNRLYLHAYYLEFTHPVTKEVVKIETEYPNEFKKIINYEK